jgi:predicted AAA+ superfamily ATPase
VTIDLEEVRGLLERHPVVGTLGARQVGKTTLAQQLAAGFDGPVHAFDGEHTFPMAEKVRALALSRLLEDLERLE